MIFESTYLILIYFQNKKKTKNKTVKKVPSVDSNASTVVS